MTKHQVAADAARAFFRAALARMTEAAAADIEEGLDSLVRYSRVRVAEGAAAEGDLIRLQVERDRAATDRVLQQVEVVRARAALLPFLVDSGNSQRSPDLVVIVDDSLLGANAALPSHDQFAARALGRPDILAARARARAAGAETALQRTLLIRQLGAVIGTRSTGGIYSMIAGVSVPVPIFDQNRGEIQRATGERLAADRELAWVERRASAEVDAAYESARLLTTQVAALDGQFLPRANEARRIAIAAYQEGAVPLLQVIDATRTLADARVTYYRALFARQGSLLDLYTSAGLDPLSALTMSLPSPDSDGINGNPHAPTGKN